MEWSISQPQPNNIYLKTYEMKVPNQQYGNMFPQFLLCTHKLKYSK
jgi:hypothetical protein